MDGLLESLLTVTHLSEEQRMALGPVATSAHELGWAGDLGPVRLDGTGTVERFSQILDQSVEDLAQTGMSREEARDLVVNVYQEAELVGLSSWQEQVSKDWQKPMREQMAIFLTPPR